MYRNYNNHNDFFSSFSNGPAVAINENRASPQPPFSQSSSIQQPPDLNSESSQSSFTNGISNYSKVPSPLASQNVMNSPKKHEQVEMKFTATSSAEYQVIYCILGNEIMLSKSCTIHYMKLILLR